MQILTLNNKSYLKYAQSHNLKKQGKNIKKF